MGEAKPMPGPEDDVVRPNLEYIGPEADKEGDEEAVGEDANTIAAATGTIGAEPHKSGYNNAQASWNQESGKKSE